MQWRINIFLKTLASFRFSLFLPAVFAVQLSGFTFSASTAYSNDRCDYCNTECTTPEVCPQCKAAPYCNGECRSKGWKEKGHRVICKELKRLRDKSTQMGPNSNIFLTEKRSKVQINCNEVRGCGLFPKEGGEEIKKYDVIAFYYGDAQPEERPKGVVPRVWDPYSYSPAREWRLTSQRDLVISKPGFLGAAMTNDGIMKWEDGRYLLEGEIIEAGRLNGGALDRIVRILAEYVEVERRTRYEMRTVEVNSSLDGFAIRALRDISKNEEIVTIYGYSYWLHALRSRLSLRGYSQEFFRVMHLLTLKLEEQSGGNSKKLGQYQEILRADWISSSLVEAHKSTWEAGKCGKSFMDFQGLLLGRLHSPSHVVLYTGNYGGREVDFNIAVFVGIRQFGTEGTLEQKIQSLPYFLSGDEDCKRIEALVNLVRQQDPREFTQPDGSYRVHPVVLDFLDDSDRGKGSTYWLAPPKSSANSDEPTILRFDSTWYGSLSSIP